MLCYNVFSLRGKTKKKEGETMSKVYEIVTEKIVSKLKEGVVPWRKPWDEMPAVNWKSQKPYRGVNTLLLEPGEYATFNQVKKAGGHVKKGEKSHLVVFWKMVEVEDEESEEGGETKTIPLLRYYNVFNIKTQCEGIESKRAEERREQDPLEEGEKIKRGYKDSPQVSEAPGRASYNPSEDTIRIPEKEDFSKVEEYYSTLFHEMVHSTGHETRLNRKEVTKKQIAFGDEDYSREELVAEIGAAMLCGVCGIENETIENSASYIQAWIERLENNKKMVVWAASRAQKAADYIRG